MKTSPVTNDDIARSVWAVPPLALVDADTIATTPNSALVSHIEAGGVSTLLWGGNANIYAMTDAVFEQMCDFIPDAVSAKAWAIPSVGPDYGKLRTHADILKRHPFPAAMLLPMTGPGDPQGRVQAVRDFVDRAGMPAILYLRSADYITPEDLGCLVSDGTAVALKYAVETGDLTRDAYLDAVLEEVPREHVVSGIGEIAAIPHLRQFGLAGFTAGAVCIAPRRAMAIRHALMAKDFASAEELAGPIQTMEDLRVAHGAIRVLHDAVTESGVANMGPLTSHLSHVSPDILTLISSAAQRLRDAEETVGD